jgi:hypothetical protein
MFLSSTQRIKVIALVTIASLGAAMAAWVLHASGSDWTSAWALARSVVASMRASVVAATDGTGTTELREHLTVHTTRTKEELDIVTPHNVSTELPPQIASSSEIQARGLHGLRVFHTMDDTADDAEADLITMDAYRARSRHVWACFPSCQQFLLLLAPPMVARKTAHGIVDKTEEKPKTLRDILLEAGAGASSLQLLWTSRTEFHLVHNVIPFALGLPSSSLDVAVGKHMKQVGRKAAVEALLTAGSNTSSTSTLIVAALGTAAQLSAWFAGLKDLQPVSYGDELDWDKVRHVLPYGLASARDMKGILDVSTDAKRMQRVVTLDTLLVQQQGRERAILARAPTLSLALLDALFADKTIMAASTFYAASMAKEFTMAGIADERLAAANKSLANADRRRIRTDNNSDEKNDDNDDGLHVGRPARAVLEQFANNGAVDAVDAAAALLIRPRSNVPGYLIFRHGGRQKVFIPTRDIDGVSLQPGDRVDLKFQERSDENDSYVAIEAHHVHNNGPLVLVNARVLTELTNKMTGSLQVKTDAKSPKMLTLMGVPLFFPAEASNKDLWKVGDRVILPTLGNDVGTISSITQSSKGSGGAVTAEIQVVLPNRNAQKSAENRSSMATCVTDTTIKSREQCESDRDAFGAKKPGGPDVWDEPCKHNTDCPYFQANKRYPNYRGGCIAGYCELPMGLKRVGYRKYYQGDESFPLCHGCPSNVKAQQACCAQGSTSADSPDYAFELDHYERAAAQSSG